MKNCLQKKIYYNKLKLNIRKKIKIQNKKQKNINKLMIICFMKLLH